MDKPGCLLGVIKIRKLITYCSNLNLKYITGRLQIKLPVVPEIIYEQSFGRLLLTAFIHVSTKKIKQKRKEERCRNRTEWVLTAGRREGGGGRAAGDKKKDFGGGGQRGQQNKRAWESKRRVWNQ